LRHAPIDHAAVGRGLRVFAGVRLIRHGRRDVVALERGRISRKTSDVLALSSVISAGGRGHITFGILRANLRIATAT
jgi:hypothetical protein